MFCEYAKEFLAAMQKAGGEMDHEDGELEGCHVGLRTVVISQMN